MRGQSNVISLVIIAGIVIGLVGASYVWAVPLIEKRTTVSEYELVEQFVTELYREIVDIANTGSGSSTIDIPKGILELRPFSFAGEGNNTLTLDFYVSQPVMLEGGSVPIKTSSLDYVGEYGTAEPRILMLSRYPEKKPVHLNMTMRFRELRSDTPKGYVIALCPESDYVACQSDVSGSRAVTVSYGETYVIPRSPIEGGELTVTKISVEAV